MNYLKVVIETEEPIMVSTALKSKGTNESLNYIPGSIIRGAFISNYIKKTGIKDIDKDERSKQWFFNNKLEFLNGYPAEGEERYLPMPAGLYSTQEELYRYKEHGGMKVKNQLEDIIEDTDKKVDGAEFISLESNETISVEKEFNVHIKKGNEKTIFRYEGIREGQTFISYIKCSLSKEEEDEVVNILNEGNFYLGGSKGSGYGRVSLKVTDKSEMNPEIIEDNYFEDEFIVYMLSDGIFLDEFGKQVSYIPEEFLKEKLQLEDVQLEEVCTENILIGGYNNKWGCRLPQYSGNKAGSLFKYSYDGELDEDLLIELMNEGIGLRTEEGFGRILILSELDMEYISKAMRINNRRKDNEEVHLSNGDKKQINSIVNRIMRNKIEKLMEEKIVNECKVKNSVSKNQIGKLIKLFVNAQSYTKEEGIRTIEEYINHLTKRSDSKERENQSAYYQLKDIRIGKSDSVKYIKAQLNSLDDSNNFYMEYDIKSIVIGGIEASLTDEEIYIYKMIELEKMFRYILRKEGK